MYPGQYPSRPQQHPNQPSPSQQSAPSNPYGYPSQQSYPPSQAGYLSQGNNPQPQVSNPYQQSQYGYPPQTYPQQQQQGYYPPPSQPPYQGAVTPSSYQAPPSYRPQSNAPYSNAPYVPPPQHPGYAPQSYQTPSQNPYSQPVSSYPSYPNYSVGHNTLPPHPSPTSGTPSSIYNPPILPPRRDEQLYGTMPPLPPRKNEDNQQSSYYQNYSTMPLPTGQGQNNFTPLPSGYPNMQYPQSQYPPMPQIPTQCSPNSTPPLPPRQDQGSHYPSTNSSTLPYGSSSTNSQGTLPSPINRPATVSHAPLHPVPQLTSSSPVSYQNVSTTTSSLAESPLMANATVSQSQEPPQSHQQISIPDQSPILTTGSVAQSESTAQPNQENVIPAQSPVMNTNASSQPQGIIPPMDDSSTHIFESENALHQDVHDHSKMEEPLPPTPAQERVQDKFENPTTDEISTSLAGIKLNETVTAEVNVVPPTPVDKPETLAFPAVPVPVIEEEVPPKPDSKLPEATPAASPSTVISLSNMDQSQDELVYPQPVIEASVSDQSDPQSSSAPLPTPPVRPPSPYASRQGNRKALLIGITYKNTRYALPNPANEIANVARYLVERLEFENDPKHILALSDTNPDEKYHPTKKNILSAFTWLLSGAVSGDSLFIHFSGHATMQMDNDGDELSGFDEAILPLDFETEGPILDDEMNAMLVQKLAPGAKLTVLFDSHFSESMLDLPLHYDPRGERVVSSQKQILHSAASSAATNLFSGKLKNAFVSIKTGIEALNKKKSNEKLNHSQAKGNMSADVIKFGLRIDKPSKGPSSSDTTGLISYAFLASLASTPQSQKSLFDIIRNMGNLLHPYRREPVLSMSRDMDIYKPFTL